MWSAFGRGVSARAVRGGGRALRGIYMYICGTEHVGRRRSPRVCPTRRGTQRVVKEREKKEEKKKRDVCTGVQ